MCNQEEDITVEQVKIWNLEIGISQRLYKEVKERLKNTKLEDITEEEIYTLFLSDETEVRDLYKPEIQQLLIKHGFISSLLRKVDYIYDKQVIKDLLSSKDYAESNLTIKPITITSIEMITLFLEKDTFYNMRINFKDKETQKEYSILTTIWLVPNQSEIERYKNEIMTNKDTMGIIIDTKEDKPVSLIKFLWRHRIQTNQVAPTNL